MKILWLVPDLGYGGAARQVCQLARAFAPEPDAQARVCEPDAQARVCEPDAQARVCEPDAQARVCEPDAQARDLWSPPRKRGSASTTWNLTVAVLGTPTPLTAELRRAGIRVQTLDWVRWFDPGALGRLRALVTELAPDIIHVWRAPALRALALAVGRPGARLLVSAPLRPGRRGFGILERWFLRHCQRLLVGCAAEADRCRRLGLPADRLEVVRPAVEALATPLAGRASDGQLVCAGRMERHKGFQEAIWAFDILHYVAPHLRLQLIGDGPERPTLERFAQQINMRSLVDFPGAVADVTEALATAALVWVPSLAPTGVQVALEALALGRPVVASRWPDLAEVVTDGETGCLVNAGDKVELARQTQQLLQDAARSRQLGAAGQARVLRDFSVSALVGHVSDLYQRLAA